jgi:DNA ligase (NAD+)
VLAATRGDGVQGEDVTHNALTGSIQGLPLTLSTTSSSSSNGNGGVLQLPAEVEVRGEVFMTTSDFEQVRREVWHSRMHIVLWGHHNVLHFFLAMLTAFAHIR